MVIQVDALFPLLLHCINSCITQVDALQSDHPRMRPLWIARWPPLNSGHRKLKYSVFKGGVRMNEFQKNVQAGPVQLGYMVSRRIQGVQDIIQGGPSSLLSSGSPLRWEHQPGWCSIRTNKHLTADHIYMLGRARQQPGPPGKCREHGQQAYDRGWWCWMSLSFSS